jgi:Protein of unknown function (DUF402)
MWSKGEVVALRDVWFGVVWRAVASVVVEDAPGRSVFWIPAGSEAAYPADAEGREIRLFQAEYNRGLRQTKVGCIVLCDDGAPWTLWHFQREDGEFDRWYVNFERYLGRGAAAYDSIDHKLDLIARPDGSLEWKDEDELVEAGCRGLVDVAEIRGDAELAVTQPPWPTGWEDFRPDPSWPIPALPEGWHRV